MFLSREADMLKTFVEEAAALASIVLFVGMIAVWAQVIPQLGGLAGNPPRGRRENGDARREWPVRRGQLGCEVPPLGSESASEVALLPHIGDRSKPMIQKP